MTPLKSFEDAQDYVADVAWSPTHPAVFASVDGSGNLAIYNINQSDTFIHQCKSPNTRGFNKLAWDKSGEFVATASLDGTVFVWDVSRVVGARSSEDLSRVSKVVREMEKTEL